MSRPPTSSSVLASQLVGIADWSVACLTKMLPIIVRNRFLFRGKPFQEKIEAWSAELAGQILSSFPNRPRKSALIGFLQRSLVLRRLIKEFNLRPRKSWSHISPLAHSGETAFRATEIKELASRIGLTPWGLEWLTRSRMGNHSTSKHYYFRWIKKRGRGYRLLECPKKKLKQVQRILLQDVLNRFPTHPSVHGFVPGRGILSFAGPHIQQDVCLKMDLENFFPSIQARRVMGWFRKAGFQSDVAWALTQLMTTQAPELILEMGQPGAAHGKRHSDSIYTIPHLPQGAPTSPMMANLIAYRMDMRLFRLLESLGGNYTRYADDILVSGKHLRSRLDYLEAKISTIVCDEGFSIQHRKTKRMGQAKRQQAAGLVLNQKVNIGRKEFDQLKAILFNAIRFGPKSQNRDGHPRFREHLRGRISWVSQLNPNRGAKLRALFNQITWPAEN